MPQLHRRSGFGAELGLASEGSDSSQDPGASPRGDRALALHEDAEMLGSGSSGSGTESHGNDSHGDGSLGNGSLGNESLASSNDNGKDSALLESSGSNKSSDSHSPSLPSSNPFSLLSSEQDNPSTSGCSSEQSAKAKTQKELLKTLKELKLHLPAEKRSKNKSGTLNTLKYALRCVTQVKANEEYYQMLMNKDSQPPGLDVSSYTIQEIDGITSEYTFKNTDTFAVAVSLTTGKIVYISDQAASILGCKRDVFKNAKFVEFLAPQDVSVFYSFTTLYRLPSWRMCTGAESSPSECMQEKSFFCRISGGWERRGVLQFLPFRMTPYLMKVQDAEVAEDQFCCLLLAERVHSGYEAPRIPTDKRIFTTTHTPNCVFQDVDERAVPLLGYLPQDLIGTPMLLHLHPSDRPIMLAVHKKILQYMGQQFDHSSIRFCARNGEFVTIDTSWSSFINPWSRKVSFVIGRHKVRMGPVNEDVFAAPAFTGGKIMDSDILEITEQIHKLLLQPVHSIGSSGYGSLGSNGSHEQLMSAPSSSESNSNGNSNANDEARTAKPRTFQEICKGVHMLKNQNQQVCMPPAARPEPRKASDTGLQQRSQALRLREAGREDEGSVEDRSTAQEKLDYSYQQISCLDSVIRYLESCNIPVTVKRKCQSSSNTASSNSDEDKQKEGENGMQKSQGISTSPLLSESLSDLPSMKAQKKAAVVGGSLAALTLPSKAESVVSVTSQCSYSSTIVHVGDKKPQPESEMIEDAAESLAPAGPPLSVVAPPSQEKEAYKKLGLTKQVLAAHTQKEEQAFLSRCRQQRDAQAFQADCSLYLGQHRRLPAAHALPAARGPRPDPTGRRGGRNKKAKKARVKNHESSDSTASHRTPPQRPPLQGLNQTSWSPSDTSQSTFPIPYPAVLPAYPLPVYPGSGPPRGADAQAGPPAPYSAPLVAPMVAFVLPNYVFPQLGGAPRQPFYPEPASFAPPTAFPAPPSYPAPPLFAPPALPLYAAPAPAFPGPLGETREGPSRCSTPLSGVARDPASPPLFESRCSSPLQLNLLQLEEAPRPAERQDGTAPPAGAPGNCPGEKGAAAGSAKPGQELQQLGSLGEGLHSDAHSSSSELLDLLLQEDSHSGTGSATSGSLGSTSHGCSTSASGVGQSHAPLCHTTLPYHSASHPSGSCQTSNTSKYFGSIDSSENNHKAKAHAEATVEESERLEFVLQEPVWLLMADADESVMMTYQLPSRDVQEVLKEDRERLRHMQKSQPHFSEDQKKELCEVHPWMRRGGLPKVLDLKECVCCKDDPSAVLKEDLAEMELGALGDPGEDRSLQKESKELLSGDGGPSLAPVL
ncbi:period circadian protein homolog 2-like [Conger conger]|uniref:period circadian protein homolog 2-like n=1 Tax=Conger conger TaxID=82655 RepID=UPI002A59DD5E|nr:period circadian protein homolog 2-like [Conger conger]